jgi:hypothetical protein
MKMFRWFVAAVRCSVFAIGMPKGRWQQNATCCILLLAGFFATFVAAVEAGQQHQHALMQVRVGGTLFDVSDISLCC